MKIGPIEIKLKAAEPKKPDLSELGATGTSFFSGVMSGEEYNTDLQGQKGATVYDKMRRSDGRVKAVLLACELPVRSATWKIEPATPDNPQDKTVADFVSDNLFESAGSWDNFLHHVLLMLPFGFSMFEKVFEIRDGQVRWLKLAPRLPKTLYTWDLDENGGLKGITQNVMKGLTYKTVPIPAEKLLVFTNEKEGSNFEGISLLRSAYKHWFYKDTLYRIDGVACERLATGVPAFSYPEEATDADKKRIDEIGRRLYAQQQQYVSLKEGYSFDVKGHTGAVKEILPSIEHHDKAIAESILADFLSLGSGQTGSWALAKDKSSFFLMALQSVAGNIADTINRYAIHQLVDYNFSVKQYPKLTCSGLDTRDIVAYAGAVMNLLNSGAITSDEGLETAMRDMLKLPAKETPAATQQKECHHTIHLADGFQPKRELTAPEKFVSFGEIVKELDSAEQKFVAATKDVMARQIDNLVDAAAKVIKAKALDKVEGLDVRYRQEMAAGIEGVMHDMFAFGRKQVKRELDAQKKEASLEGPLDIGPLDVASLEIINKYLRSKAQVTASMLAMRLRNYTVFEVLRQIKAGVLDEVALKTGLAGLSDKELLKSAQYTVSEAFNYGRSTQAEKESDSIERVQYSSLLDGDTCEICRPLDGQEWDYDDPRTAYYASGNPDCLGGDRCRCVLVYVYSSERRNPR